MHRLPIILMSTLMTAALAPADTGKPLSKPTPLPGHLEQPDDSQAPPPDGTDAAKLLADVVRGSHTSVQVNVDEDGFNIPNDAANEPSITVDPTAPNRIAIGWRQFDRITSNFRKAGWGYSRDGGRSWSFPGSLEETVFRSDPVLAADSEGRFYYYSLLIDDGGEIICDLWFSDDAGQSWYGKKPAWGGDKAWISIDRTGGIGDGNFYASWTILGKWGSRVFTRSTDRGETLMDPIVLTPAPIWGTTAVGPDGELYIGGNAEYETGLFVLWRSLDARDPNVIPTFELSLPNLGGIQQASLGPNPGGLLGQIWVDVDRSDGPNRGNVYMVGSVEPYTGSDPMDLHFIRSTDGGVSFSDPIAIIADDRGAWQWFGTMSVAPNGRIDVIWVESLDGTSANLGELYYAASTDAGYSWSTPEALTPSFDSFLGWPRQEKLGDYYHMISDEVGAHLTYAATFNGEQDVYYLRIGDWDCNGNGIGDGIDLESGAARDCNDNDIPDSCEVAADPDIDLDGNGQPDSCAPMPRRGGRRFVP